MTATEPRDASRGSAGRWGPLWGARPRDWAISEDQQLPTYRAAADRVGIDRGMAVLDVGCGTGRFLQLAAERGARTSGLDASEELLALARERLEGAELIAGEMEALPWPDDSFDLVTGFNSFFFAHDIVAALREAARVARPGASVVVGVWGDPERCDLEVVRMVMRRHAPPPPGPSNVPALWQPGTAEQIAREGDLEPIEAFEISWGYEYKDEEEAGRALIAPMGLAAIVGPEREPAVRAEIVTAIAPFRRADGSYRLTNEFRILLARA